MLAVISADAAQDLARQGLVQLVDGTWQMPGSDPAAKPLSGPQIVIDTDALKAVPVENRARDCVELFKENGLMAGKTACIYDRAGLFSAPWIVWLIASHGQPVALVEGSGPTGEFEIRTGKGDFNSIADPAKMNATKQDVLDALGTDVQIVDARPPGRFAGTEKEPRPECRAGHIPGSVNLPFGSLKDGAAFKEIDALMAAVENAGIDLNKPIITSCGSGVTASGVAFVLHRLGARDVRVYQGSWAEWGVDHSLPIETGAA